MYLCKFTPFNAKKKKGEWVQLLQTIEVKSALILITTYNFSWWRAPALDVSILSMEEKLNLEDLHHTLHPETSTVTHKDQATRTSF